MAEHAAAPTKANATPAKAGAAPVAPETHADGGKKKLFLLIIIGAVAVLVIGGGLFLFRDKIFGGSKAEAATETAQPAASVKKQAKTEESTASEEEPAPKPKKKKKKVTEEAAAVLALDPFTINLQDTENTRYMRLAVNLGLTTEALAKEAGEKPILKSRVRDAIMRHITTLSAEDVLSKNGKEKLIEKLIEVTNQVLEDGVVDVYIQELIVQ